MRLRALSVLFSLLCFAACGGGSSSSPTPETPGALGAAVNTFTGTAGVPWTLGMLWPGPTSPFGMVRLGPDTSFSGGVHLQNVGTAGYYYEENHILGFSHTRLSGTGATDGGAFRVRPFRTLEGELPDVASREARPLPFRKETESATAGYYRVYLDTVATTAELTSTIHAGVHRYRFEAGRSGWLGIDSTSSLVPGSSEGFVEVLADAREVIGAARIDGSFAGRYGGLKAYYVARFDRAFRSFGTWQGGSLEMNRASAEGPDVGAAVEFIAPGDAGTVDVALAISYVSLENARANLDAEIGARVDFVETRNRSRAEWESALGRIRIRSSDDEVRRIFYTALYHSLIMPTSFTDVNGEYLGFGRTIGIAEDFIYRSDLSLWDTFRTEHPLLALVAPEVQRDSVKSLIRMARVGGTLPRWAAGGGYAGSMFGSPAHFVIAESYLKGITDFEAEEALGYMIREALEPPPTHPDPTISPKGRGGIEQCVALGFCPDDEIDWSVSRTLEYAWADAAVSGFANALGDLGHAELFAERAQAYRNTWNPESRFFHPRAADGTWFEPFDPNANEYLDQLVELIGGERKARAYAEGSARQYRYSVPHDPQGLIELIGGNEVFAAELEGFLEDATEELGGAYPGSGYWHGNQHDMHVIFLFNEAQRPELTQKWTRWALTTRYDATEVGLDGNDDGGTMSSWYLLAGGLGLYPMAGSDRYWVTAPIVERAEANLGNGTRLIVTTEHQALDHPYIQQVRLDGERLCEPRLTHDRIGTGANLHFVLGPNPAPAGGFDC